MIFYHGTLTKNKLLIEKQGVITVSTKGNSPYSHTVSTQTTYGYVYLTTNVIHALYFGLISIMRKIEGCRVSVTIFEVELGKDDPDLSEDEDELRHASNYDGISTAETSYRIKRDLRLGFEIKRSWTFGFKDYKEGDYYLDSPQKFPDLLSDRTRCQQNLYLV